MFEQAFALGASVAIPLALLFITVTLLTAICLDIALEIGRLVRLPRTIGRFAAEVVNSFHQHRA
jgi:hypothetical protein